MSSEKGSPWRRRLGTAARVLLTGGLFWLIGRQADPAAMLELLRTSVPGYLLAAAVLVPFNYLLATLSWLRLARRVDDQLTLRDAARAIMGGQALSILTPARAGDFVGRALIHPRGSRWTWVTAVAAEGWYKYPGPLCLGALALWNPAFESLEPEQAWTLLRYAGLAIGITVAILAVRPHGVPALLDRLRLPDVIVRNTRFLSELTPMDGIFILSMNITRYLVASAQLGLLVLAFYPALSVWSALIGGMVVLGLKVAIPSFTIADLGIRETAAVFFLGFLAVPNAVALNASLSLYVLNVVAPALAGSIVWLRRS